MSAGLIQLISASAGSGKTHRLVNELENAIAGPENAVRPEAVVATTFTIKAAAELRERVRSRLLESGYVEKAQRLGAARIGTVNSICAQLVTDFAFELGISPETRVLDEVAAAEAFNRALSGVASAARDEENGSPSATSDAAADLMEIGERLPGLDWLKDVRGIASRARENGLGANQLRDCARRSAEGLLACFGAVEADGDRLDRALESALDTFLSGPIDSTKTTRDAVEFARQVHARLRARRPVAWSDWAKLAAAKTAVASHEAYEPVRAAARGHERHPALREDVRQTIEHVFDLAAQAIEAYERYKREWGLMDFVDQEVMALRLLREPEVQEMLREQVDLVLVDEFQDTSPLQLDIFLALSRLSPRSVWVGDQKQSIYAFRGTDPALMDAAIEAIVKRAGERAHDSLQYSYRSRAELVRLTSHLFAPAFEATGIPAERVRLQPAPEIEARADTMGPIVESWVLNTTNKDNDAAALAAAVRQLLDDGDVVVRDVITDEDRRVRPRDIAILSRSGDNCALVTAALEGVGIPAVRPRTGLVSTPEARLTLAALRLWVDPHQPLAAAEIGRLLVHADDADKWLQTVLDAPGKAYTEQAEIVRVAEARARLPLAGPLEAFDEVVAAVGVREACLRWGRASQRLANLDQLRALVHRYVATCETEGEAATVAGLVSHLADLRSEDKDDQATLSREDAVTVGTLHSAKGLEWPITVLHAIDSPWKPTAFGVHVVSDREGFDFDAPLSERWIRYWPDPYAPQGRRPTYEGKAALHENVRGRPEHAEACRRSARETLRLLYVGWTRARDRVVLTGRPGKTIGTTLGLLRDRAGTPLITVPEAECTWAGRRVSVKVRNAEPAVGIVSAPRAGLGYDEAGPRRFPPASADISKLPGTGHVDEVEKLGAAPFIQAPVDFLALGTAVHAFLAADRPGLARDDRLVMAAGVLERWSVQGSLSADALVAAADRLNAWIERRWPDADWHREWPVRLRKADGTELVGFADLVLMHGDHFLIVDHKCISATGREALQAAAGYGGQIGAYADAIAKATGKSCAGCFVHLVAQGLVAAVGPMVGQQSR